MKLRDKTGGKQLQPDSQSQTAEDWNFLASSAYALAAERQRDIQSKPYGNSRIRKFLNSIGAPSDSRHS